MSSVREFLTSRSGKRQFGMVTIGGRQIKAQSLTFAEQSTINLAFFEVGVGDIREDAHQLRQALFVARSLLEEDGSRAFSDSEADLRILIALMAKDMETISAEIKDLAFMDDDSQGSAAGQKKGTKLAKMKG